MSAFEDAVIQRIKRLEREVERLQKWERPVIITDHGALTGLADDDHPQYRKVADSIDHGTLSGLADNDHPQYLLTTGKAADSDKLDGIDSTGFATSTHNHTGTYLPINGKAADSDKLDGVSSTGFVNTDYDQAISGTKYFNAVPVVNADPTLATHVVRKGYADSTYLGVSAKAADSDKLDGVDITAFKGLNSLSDPNADRVLFWDDSAGALKWLTVGGIVDTDFGKWQAHTVSWTAVTTNPSIGNGTLAGRYNVIGKLCTYVLGLVMGSTTTYGSGNWAFSLPINAVNTAGINFYGVAHLRNALKANYERIAQIAPSVNVDKISLFIDPTQGSNSTNLSATVPFTWGEGDSLGFEITYEVA